MREIKELETKKSLKSFNLFIFTLYFESFVIGSKIYEEKNANFINNTIKIKELKSGIYLLKIENTISSITKKIIIR